MAPVRWNVIGLIILLAVASTPVQAQEIDVGGRAFVDYFYNITSPTAAEEGFHGFRYRRLYLTTDFTLSEAVEGRARLEASDETVGTKGPVPYVKDLSVTWTYSGAHSATVGVTPPPAFEASEDVWGYRSLDKTILDLQGIVSSRDFGLRFDGPVAGLEVLEYAVMVANNSGVRPETDNNKRVYGQLQVAPTEQLTFVVGGDYAGYGAPHEDGLRLSAFGGYSTDRFRLGVEGYWFRLDAVDERDARTDVGGSVFGRLKVGSSWEAVARLDRSRETGLQPRRLETFAVAGIAYRPHPNVALIPNLRVQAPSDTEAETTGRVTVEVNF